MQESDVPTTVDAKYTNPLGESTNHDTLYPSDRERKLESSVCQIVPMQSLIKA